MKHIASICLAVLIAAASARGADLFPTVHLDKGASKAQIDAVLVSVNGEPVTLLDILLETTGAERELAGLVTGERLLNETKQLRARTLESIILRKLLYQKYLETPFPVPPQEIENVIDAISRDMGVTTREMLEERLSVLGFSLAKLKERAKERLVTEAMLRQLCDREVYVTPREVYEEYASHPERWTEPAAINLQLIQILRENGRAGANPAKYAENLRKSALGSSYEIFRELVRQHSDSSMASSGGETGYMPADKLRPEFAAALKGLQAGETVGPVETPEAFYFIRICGSRPAKKIPFSKIRDRIEKELMDRALTENRRKYEEKLREKAVIRYFGP